MRLTGHGDFHPGRTLVRTLRPHPGSSGGRQPEAAAVPPKVTLVEVYDNVVELVGQHPAGPAQPGHRGLVRDRARQGGVPEPRRVGQGPDRPADDRGRRGVRRAEAGRHDRRADQRQHRRRPGPGGPAEGLPLRVRLPGQGQRGQAQRAARRTAPRWWSARPPSRRSTPTPTTTSATGWCRRSTGAWKPDQYSNPENPAVALRVDRAGAVGADRRPDHALRQRGRHRRHDQRHRPLPQGGLRRARPGHRRRPRGLGLLRRDRSAVPGRRRRRGLLADRLRPGRSPTRSSPCRTGTRSR